MTTGRGLIGPTPAGPLQVAYWNAEDPDEKIERRIAAACLHHGVDPEHLRDRLFLGSKLTGSQRVATISDGNVVFNTNMLHYLRVQRDKTNLAPPGKATWVHLVDVELPNGDSLQPGDHVQTIEAWDYPQPFDNVTADDMRWIRETTRQRDYRYDSRSPDWVGLPLAERLRLDPDNPGDRRRLNAILRIWLTNGVLAIETRKDEARRERQYVVPGQWKEED
jgi:hypothetical protein